MPLAAIVIDWSVSVGNMLVAAGFIAGGIFFVLMVRRDVDILGVRLVPLEKAVVQLTEVLITLARQDVRLGAVERDLQRNDPRQQRREPGSR